jgi:rRNA processing protein Gar1
LKAKNIITACAQYLGFPSGDGYLKFLGKTLHISKSGLLTVKTESLPKIGSQAFHKGRAHLGTIIDVFGPVSSPYASVKLRRDVDTHQLRDAEIWWEEARPRRGRGYHAKRHY